MLAASKIEKKKLWFYVYFHTFNRVFTLVWEGLLDHGASVIGFHIGHLMGSWSRQLPIITRDREESLTAVSVLLAQKPQLPMGAYVQCVGIKSPPCLLLHVCIMWAIRD